MKTMFLLELRHNESMAKCNTVRRFPV